ncbi:NAD(P)-dependent alcohol dehydrogenase [Herbidospora sp. RD11066]
MNTSTLVDAYAAPAPKAPLEKIRIPRRAVGDHDVRIDISYSGICHSDVLQVEGAWGGGSFPMVPGHEFTGVVSATGAGVTRFAVGDRVGVGTLVDSCRECAFCLAGEPTYCRSSVLTYGGYEADGTPTHGGYSTGVVVDENYVVRVPDALDLAKAAPLMCAGITVYAPLKRFGVGPGTKIAVLGMGGLGHLAVKMAVALGAEVTVLSRTLGKRDDGLAYGAVDYRATEDPATLTDLADHFAIIVSTVSASLNFDHVLGLLAFDGALVNLGVPDGPISMSMFPIIMGRRSFTSSAAGSLTETQEMLDFCAAHGIETEIETIEAAYVNTAYERLNKGDVRYRFVIDNATI